MHEQGWEMKLSEGRWSWYEVWIEAEKMPKTRVVVYERGMGFAVETAVERFIKDYAAKPYRVEVKPGVYVVDGRERLKE